MNESPGISVGVDPAGADGVEGVLTGIELGPPGLEDGGGTTVVGLAAPWRHCE